MRLLLLVVVSSGIALADVPKGQYQLETKLRGEIYKGIASCGPQAVDFLDRVGRIDVEHARTVKVNGSVWKPFSTNRDEVAVVRDDLLDGLVVYLSFGRDRDEHARGRIAVFRVDQSGFQCMNGRWLDGTFRR